MARDPEHETFHVEVRDHPDDGAPGFLGPRPVLADLPSDDVAVWEEPLRETPIHDRDRRRRLVVPGAKITAGTEDDAERLEEPGRDGHQSDLRIGPVIRVLDALDRNLGAAGP